jgi:hypothetical protein
MAMIQIDTSLVTNAGISAQDVTNYALSKGWRLATSPNSSLALFLGATDDAGNPIQLLIPCHDRFMDAALRLAEAVRLLADVEDRSMVDVIAEIDRQRRLSIGTTSLI